MTNAASREERLGHHAIPRHVLARFANPDGRLTVVRKSPELKVLRRQKPENVGVHRRLYSVQLDDGTWDDVLEREPLDRLDNAGSREFDEAVTFAIDADAQSHMRLLDWSLEQRAGLQLFIAGLMVRTPELRSDLDAQALPTLLKQMLANLDEAAAAGNIDSENLSLLRKTFNDPNAVRLDEPAFRHQALLVPLIERVATRLHLDHLVAVRRFAEPLLFTGSQPVVVFPDFDPTKAISTARLLAGDVEPVRMWEQRAEMLAAVADRLSAIAGIGVALDPHTLLLMFNPDTEDGNKLINLSTKVEGSALAGIVNITMYGGSTWVAGRDDCGLLSLMADATDKARRDAATP